MIWKHYHSLSCDVRNVQRNLKWSASLSIWSGKWSSFGRRHIGEFRNETRIISTHVVYFSIMEYPALTNVWREERNWCKSFALGITIVDINLLVVGNFRIENVMPNGVSVPSTSLVDLIVQHAPFIFSADELAWSISLKDRLSHIWNELEIEQIEIKSRTFIDPYQCCGRRG